MYILHPTRFASSFVFALLKVQTCSMHALVLIAMGKRMHLSAPWMCARRPSSRTLHILLSSAFTLSKKRDIHTHDSAFCFYFHKLRCAWCSGKECFCCLLFILIVYTLSLLFNCRFVLCERRVYEYTPRRDENQDCRDMVYERAEGELHIPLILHREARVHALAALCVYIGEDEKMENGVFREKSFVIGPLLVLFCFSSVAPY
jgi:hypothetical protein